MNRPMQTRSLTEGAMLAAITVVLTLLGVYFFGYLLFITPVPIAVLVYRHGLRSGILVSITAAVVSGIFGSMITTVVFLLVFGLIGIAIGGALYEGFSAPKVMAVGTAVSLGAFLLLGLVASLFFDANLIDETFQMLRESFERTFSLYDRFGIDSSQMLGGLSLDRLLATMRMVLPSTLLMSAVVLSFVNFALTRLVLRRIGSRDIPWFTPFKNWRYPWYLAWGYIAAKGLLVYIQLTGNESALGLTLNLEIIFNYIFMIQGLAIAWFFFDQWGLNRPIRILLLFFALNPRLAQVVVLLGVLDTWLDFRRLGVQSDD